MFSTVSKLNEGGGAAVCVMVNETFDSFDPVVWIKTYFVPALKLITVIWVCIYVAVPRRMGVLPDIVIDVGVMMLVAIA